MSTKSEAGAMDLKGLERSAFDRAIDDLGAKLDALHAAEQARTEALLRWMGETEPGSARDEASAAYKKASAAFDGAAAIVAATWAARKRAVVSRGERI